MNMVRTTIWFKASFVELNFSRIFEKQNVQKPNATFKKSREETKAVNVMIFRWFISPASPFSRSAIDFSSCFCVRVVLCAQVWALGHFVSRYIKSIEIFHMVSLSFSAACANRCNVICRGMFSITSSMVPGHFLLKTCRKNSSYTRLLVLFSIWMPAPFQNRSSDLGVLHML